MEEDGRRWKKMEEEDEKNTKMKKSNCWGWSGDLSWGTNRPQKNKSDLVTTKNCFSYLSGMVTNRFVRI